MLKCKVIICLVPLVLTACGSGRKENFHQLNTIIIDLSKPSIKQLELPKEKKPVVMIDVLRPAITGDFDGDSITDTLRSVLYSRTQKKVLYQIPEDAEMGYMCEQDPVFYLSPNKSSIPRLRYAEWSCQIYGPSKLANIGDLNNDGKDEVILIMNFADMSSLNGCHIFSLCNNQWKDIFSFRIYEFVLEDEMNGNNPNDVSHFIYRKDSTIFYRELMPEGDMIKKMKKLNPCE